MNDAKHKGSIHMTIKQFIASKLDSSLGDHEIQLLAHEKFPLNATSLSYIKRIRRAHRGKS